MNSLIMGLKEQRVAGGIVHFWFQAHGESELGSRPLSVLSHFVILLGVDKGKGGNLVSCTTECILPKCVFRI